jgi:hypothetical protein
LKKKPIGKDEDEESMGEIDSKLRKSTASRRISRMNESVPNLTALNTNVNSLSPEKNHSKNSKISSSPIMEAYEDEEDSPEPHRKSTLV